MSLRLSKADSKRCLWVGAGGNKAKSVYLKVPQKPLQENTLDSSDPKYSALLLNLEYLAEC